MQTTETQTARETAILRLESAKRCCEELDEFPVVAADLVQIRAECDSLLLWLQSGLAAGDDEFDLIERMEYWLLVLDADCRPLE